MFEKNEMLSYLQDNICEVTFIKSNGTKRVMKCTLKKELLPVQTGIPEGSNHKTRTISDDVIACYDVENSGWRSFRIDSVENFVV